MDKFTYTITINYIDNLNSNAEAKAFSYELYHSLFDKEYPPFTNTESAAYIYLCLMRILRRAAHMQPLLYYPTKYKDPRKLVLPDHILAQMSYLEQSTREFRSQME